MESQMQSVRKMIWPNIIFFSVTTLVALFGTPYYVIRYGISLPDLCLFVFFLMATGLGITVGYHRLFSHVTYKANPVVQFLLLVFGAAAFEQSAYRWSSQHRDHHRFVDTDRDPYSIKKGFWYAHIGWLIFWQHPANHENVKDLQQNKMVMNQHRYYLLWAVASGIFLPIIIGALTGHMLGAFILSVCLRLTLVYHSTFFINSICHMFGKATYDIYSSAKDNGLIAFLTNGEGYHNFHHRFPSDYRNGVRWYQWDPSKWTIYLLSLMGVCQDLKRVSSIKILDARLAGEKQRLCDSLAKIAAHPEVAKMLEVVHHRYAELQEQLVKWEQAVKDYRTLKQQRLNAYSQEVKKAARRKAVAARRYFEQTHAKWVLLTELPPIQLRKYLVAV